MDPFKYAIHKLIGRFDLRKSLPVVTDAMEDWTWMHLSLIRETASGSSYQDATTQKYTLSDLAKTIVRSGEAHFDPQGTRPLVYFQQLCITGQFELVSVKSCEPSRGFIHAVYVGYPIPVREGKDGNRRRTFRNRSSILWPSPCTQQGTAVRDGNL